MAVRFCRPQPWDFSHSCTNLLRKERCFQEVVAAATALSGIVTSSMLSGVLDEIVGLLPVVIPVMIGFIALRKGLSFVMGMLRAA